MILSQIQNIVNAFSYISSYVCAADIGQIQGVHLCLLPFRAHAVKLRLQTDSSPRERISLLW